MSNVTNDRRIYADYQDAINGARQTVQSVEDSVVCFEAITDRRSYYSLLLRPTYVRGSIISGIFLTNTNALGTNGRSVILWGP